MNEHPVIGNQVFWNGRTFSFDSPKAFSLLEEWVEPYTVFTTLNRQGYATASFSYVLGMGASHHLRPGIRDGLRYQRNEFNKLDGRLIGTLEDFLQSYPPESWPEFIYLHLLGVDGYSHLFGHKSNQVISYIKDLDSKLSGIFRLLRNAEGHRKEIITLLTADHGFVDTKHFANLEDWIHKVSTNVVVLNQHRILSLYAKAERPPVNFLNLMSVVSTQPGVELACGKPANRLQCYKNGVAWEPGKKAFHGSVTNPFLASSLEVYFSSPMRPKGIVFAQEGYSFFKDYLGDHGGVTANEVLVPLLLRNAEVTPPDKIPSTSDVLKDLIFER